jgi:deoxyribodipyrimidine photo-lyase
MTIQVERIKSFNEQRAGEGRYVLYWMQASQRSTCNHALEYAILQANDLNLPLLVYLGLTEAYPGANARHYAFMLEGLQEMQKALLQRGIGMVVWLCSPAEGALRLAQDAALVVTDRGYLRHQQAWRQEVASRIDKLMVQVESDVVVPVETASGKEAWAAATLRPRIHRAWQRFLSPLEEREVRIPSAHLDLAAPGLDLAAPGALLGRLQVDRSVKPVRDYVGGMHEAQRRLQDFIERRLDHYDAWRNDPVLDGLSHLSPYLHFGQISPLDIALQVQAAGGPGAQSFLEELIVRRELAINFCFYNALYDSFLSLPAWARKTLEEHQSDVRDPLYTPEELERAETHDPYWNAAQQEMAWGGKMHGYMRMYWGKKILEWSRTPQEAMHTALALNDKYELDGRDPNGYAGVAWCLGKHDRPWAERPIFGKTRYMSASGLERKFDIEAYVQHVAEMKPKEV